MALGPLAEFLGYSPKCTRRILAARRVPVRQFNYRSFGRPRWCVCVDEARIAVEEWNQLETVGQAAQRLHVDETNLRDWLIAHGEEPPTPTASGKLPPWRNLSEVYDTVAALHHPPGKESLSAAARRLGISRPTLRAALHRSRPDLAAASTTRWQLEPRVYDAVCYSK
jgi:transposase-like protein